MVYLMEVRIPLDEDEETLVNYYAKTLGLSVEDACKGAVMYSIRMMFEKSCHDINATSNSWDNDPEEAGDDTALNGPEDPVQ